MIRFSEKRLNKSDLELGDCVELTSVQSLLAVNSGLMVVPKPTTLSLVPEGRLFSATTIASCGNKTR